MKFTFRTVSGSRLRKGSLTGFKRLPDLTLETPLLLLYTKGGSIPHITHEVLQLLTTEQQAVQMPLPSTYLVHGAVKEFKQGLAKFVGLQECLTYFSIQDPAYKTPEGYNTKNDISVWTHTGRKILNPHKFMDAVEAFQPDLYEILAHGDTNVDASVKKITKVADISRDMYEYCMERHSSSSVLKGTGVLACIEGGYDLHARKKCAASFSGAPVDGFVINSLHNNGPEVEKLDIDKIRPVVEATIDDLPAEKFRVLHGCWTPQNLLHLVEMGVDILDASYPYLVTERMSGLVFGYEAAEMDRPVKGIDSPMEISLGDSKYREDFSPLVAECTCLSCTKHTKAYVHHLIKNKELLASTLLMIHNLHHYLQFFKAIRSAISEDKKLILK